MGQEHLKVLLEKIQSDNQLITQISSFKNNNQSLIFHSDRGIQNACEEFINVIFSRNTGL